jgi:uncharacterized protein (DUF488 family)
MKRIYTVGHSNQSIDAFIALLKSHNVDVVADVRSRPYSARFPHFSKDRLEASLKAAGIRYVFLGRELGARRDEAECYVNGLASYERISKLPAFADGINRLLIGAQRYRLTLMCAEHDPLTCHRTILVCHELKKHGILIKHICRTGALEDHEQTELRLLEEEFGGSDQIDMFAGTRNATEILELAYARRADSIAYRRDEHSDDHSHNRVRAESR